MCGLLRARCVALEKNGHFRELGERVDAYARQSDDIGYRGHKIPVRLVANVWKDVSAVIVSASRLLGEYVLKEGASCTCAVFDAAYDLRDAWSALSETIDRMEVCRRRVPEKTAVLGRLYCMIRHRDGVAIVEHRNERRSVGYTSGELTDSEG